MSNVPRKRASLCCAECNRRKVSCDKRIPCGRCIQAGLRDSCTRARSGQTGSSPAAFRENRDHDQVASRATTSYEVRSRSPRSPPARPAVSYGITSGSPISPPETRNSHNSAEYDEVTHAATVLEFLAWGKRKETSFTTHLEPCVDEPALSPDVAAKNKNGRNEVSNWGESEDSASLRSLQLLLPERDKVDLLVDYHLDCLLWYHGSFHGPSFRVQLTEFYDQHHGDLNSSGLDLQWVALLFSVLAGSISCGNKAVLLRWGFEEMEQELLSHKWLAAVVSCLNAAGYMANLSMRSCEAIATLTISAHILGYSNQQSVLLASAVRIAQSLGLHRLHNSSIKTVERETGRRVWAQLCSQDWFSIPFSESYLVNPLYCQSAEPLNCDDETLDELSDAVPTVTSYCRYLYSVATLMPALQDSILRSNTLYTKYNHVMAFDQKMRSLASEQRPMFLCNVPLEPSWPSWIPWARRAAAISSAHKIIMVHRKFLTMSFTNSAFAFTRRTCIAASKTILKEVSKAESDGGPVLWIYHAFAVAAGVTLCLDALHRDGSDTLCVEHCRMVEEATVQLRAAHNSKIAARGNKILTELLQLELKTRSGRNKQKRKLGSGETNHRLESSQLQEFVRGLQYRTSPGATRRDERGAESSSPADEPRRVEAEQVYAETNVLPDFEMAEETLASFHSSYFSHSADAFGDLLNLAQTYSY